ncbi:MAG: class I SAM-dependent methyltransferase, partial [Candidatus Eremiobacteraeota bacterium]|nr:class I SAM-dependent methyltransferase [Candidatus Eremiobacteraeota bacterium]
MRDAHAFADQACVPAGTNDLLLERAGDLLEDEWLELLARSADVPLLDGMRMPLFPATDVQRRFVGNSGRNALHEAERFYRLVKNAARQLANPIGRDSNVLDFGCGWGRMIRYFLRDVNPANLYGCDVLPEAVALCRSLDLRANFELIEPAPPSRFPDMMFHVIFAYSVFSHLSEDLHMAWIREISRILRPNGILVATTHSRRFIDYCAELRAQDVHATRWHE